MAPVSAPILDETITLKRRIGGGTSGEVWEAHQAGADRLVAVKLRHERASTGDWSREARLLARVEHPHIVSVLLHGRLDGKQALVLERVDGADLESLIARLRERDAAPSTESAVDALELDSTPAEWSDPFWRTAACIVRDIARALDHAHRCGVVHRDVKPANVLIDRSGSARLTDFGLAAARGDDGDESAGTLAYMAPERLAGERATPSSDVFSLGVLMEELVTLRPPIRSTSTAGAIAEIADGREHAHGDAIPRDLDSILRRATDPRPERRYRTAGDFARDLEALLGDRPILARPEGITRRAARFVRHHRVALLSSLVVVTSLVVGASVVGTQVLRSAEREKRAAELAGAATEAALTGWSQVILQSSGTLGDGKSMLDRAKVGVVRLGIEMGDELLATTTEGSDQHSRLLGTRAIALTSLASAELEVGNLDEAVEQVNAARALADHVPESIRPRLFGRCALIELSIASVSGDSDEIVRAADRARALICEPDDVDPKLLHLRPSVWSVLTEHSLSAGRNEEGLAYAERCVEAAEALPLDSEEGSSVTGRTERARAYSARTAALVNLGRFDEAAQDAERTLAVLEGSVPAASTWRIRASAWNNLGAAHRAAKRYDEALDAEQRALSLQERARTAAPDALEPKFEHTRSLFRIALTRTLRGDDPAEVDTAYADALERSNAVLEEVPNHVAALQVRLAIHENRGVAAMREKRVPEMEGHFALAVEDYVRLCEISEVQPSDEKLSAYVRMWLGAHLSVHSTEESLETLAATAERFATSPRVACDAAAMAAQLGRRLGPDDGELAERAREQAIDLLLRAIERGYREREWIETTPTFDQVREHPRFDEVLRALD